MLRRIMGGVCAGLVIAGIAALTPSASLATTAKAEAAATAAVNERPVFVQFRDLFARGGKPSEAAVALSGRRVVMTGFSTPPPTMESPFLVFVGAPTNFCPYCSSIHEEDHLPYVLIYPENEEVPIFGLSARILVTGTLQASHDYDPFYGIHNDVRILDATIARDERAINPVRQPRAALGNRAGRGAARQ